MLRKALVGLAVAAAMLGTVGFAQAAPGGVTLTSAELTKWGFPKKPNVVAWSPGTAKISAHQAPAGQDVVITGVAPDYAPVGQVLTMSRFVADDHNGDGTMKALNINTTVNANRSFTLHFQLGTVGTFGYDVGYATTGMSPERIAFQFQFTTTGAKGPGVAVSAKPVTLNSKQLAAAGFTKTANVVGWGGTAKLSASNVGVGESVTLAGRAPSYVQAGSVLSLEQFVATDKVGSGQFVVIPAVTATVGSDGKFTVTFTPLSGTHGYTFGVGQNFEWIGTEFQVTAG